MAFDPSKDTDSIGEAVNRLTDQQTQSANKKEVKKVYSVTLYPSTKQKLDALIAAKSEEGGVSIGVSAYVEFLINQEFSRK